MKSRLSIDHFIGQPLLTYYKYFSSFILCIVDHFAWRVWRFQRVEVRQKLIKLFEDGGNEKYDVFQKIVFVPLLNIRVLPVIME